MRCEDAAPDLGPLLNGELAPAAEQALLDHLATCATCQAEAERLRDLWLRLGDVAIEPPDTARMRQRFVTAVESFQTGVDQARVEALERRPVVVAGGFGAHPVAFQAGARARSLGWLAALAASLVIGVLVGRETVRPAASPAITASTASADLAAMRQELHDTRELVSLALLRQPSASERLKGVSWTERIDDAGADVVAALLDTLAHDPNVNVRLAAIEALTRYADRPGVRSGAVAALTGASSSPLVQVALIDLLVQLNEPSSKDSLRQLVDDARTDGTVRDRAKQALQQLG